MRSDLEYERKLVGGVTAKAVVQAVKFMFMILTSFLIGFAAAASPGVVQMSILHNSLSGKKTQSLILALGCCSMNFVILMIAYFGLSQFIKIPFLYYAIGSIGCAYMLYLGYGSLKVSLKPVMNIKLITNNYFINGMLLCLLSPLTYIYFAGIATAFTKFPIYQAAIYSLILSVGSFACYSVVTLIGATIHKHGNTKVVKALQVASSVAIIFFAIILFANLITG